MSNNIKVLLIGCGYMGIECTKVLTAQGIRPIVVGRGKGKQKFSKKKQGLVLYRWNREISPKFL